MGEDFEPERERNKIGRIFGLLLNEKNVSL